MAFQSVIEWVAHALCGVPTPSTRAHHGLTDHDAVARARTCPGRLSLLQRAKAPHFTSLLLDLFS